MLIYCVKLDHALYSINYGMSIFGGGGGWRISYTSGKYHDPPPPLKIQ